MKEKVEISVVIPVYNERENVVELHSRILKVLQSIVNSFEIIFVDDGSKDGTFEEIKKLKNVSAYRFIKNFGQSHATSCGIEKAQGEIIVTLDGDLENHPEDIPKLVDKLGEGFDVATGWRKNRWENSFFKRKLPSLIANWAISRISNVKIHDNGCGITAYKAEVFNEFEFSDQIHRMIIPYLAVNGANVCEVPVGFTARKYGKSKYGISRAFKVILDLISYSFFKTYSNSPMHFFGFAGLFFIFLAVLSFIWSFYLKIGKDINFNRTPLPELIVVFVVVGFQFILMGLLAEIFTRTLRKKSEYKIYKIEDEYSG